MRQLIDDDLWPAIDRLAQQQPDRTDDLVAAVLRDLGISIRKVNACGRMLLAVASQARDIPTGAPVQPIRLRDQLLFFRTLTSRGRLLIAMIYGMQLHGDVTWRNVLDEASVEFEMAAVVVPSRIRAEQRRSR